MKFTFKLPFFAFFISFCVAIGALLVGFHSGIVAGALLFLKGDFQLNSLQEGVVVSLLLLGAAVGSIGGGFLADFFGRKKTLFFTVFLFVIGAILLAFADNYFSLGVGRVVAGLGVGIASVTVPLYIAEIAPPEFRGALVSLNQLFMNLGIFISYLVSLYFAPLESWRGMFLFSLALAILQGILLFFVPETPPWLAEKGFHEKAKKILSKIGLKFTELVSHKEPTKLDKSIRKTLFIGIGLSLFQQITGINTVIYYAPQIFQKASEISSQDALFFSLIFSIINVLVTFISLWLVDTIGRRILILIGFGGMALSLLLLGISFFYGGILSLIAVIFYVSFFALSVGPCTWLILSEIFPESVRGRVMGIPLLVNWLSNYLVSLTFLPMTMRIGESTTFWLYGVISVIAFYFVWKKVPETKGKTLSEIQSFWKK